MQVSPPLTLKQKLIYGGLIPVAMGAAALGGLYSYSLYVRSSACAALEKSVTGLAQTVEGRQLLQKQGVKVEQRFDVKTGQPIGWVLVSAPKADDPKEVVTFGN